MAPYVSRRGRTTASAPRYSARGDKTICWPDTDDVEQTGVLRPCQVLANGRPARIVLRNRPPTTAKASVVSRPEKPAARTAAAPRRQPPAPKLPQAVAVGDVIARLADATAGDARDRLAAFGFVPVADGGLRRGLAGNTLSESRSLTYFAASGDASVRDDFFGRTLSSKARWTVRDGAVLPFGARGSPVLHRCFRARPGNSCAGPAWTTPMRMPKTR